MLDRVQWHSIVIAEAETISKAVERIGSMGQYIIKAFSALSVSKSIPYSWELGILSVMRPLKLTHDDRGAWY